jgi:serine/threonine-protein kinase
MGEIFLAKRVGVGGFEKTVVLKCMLDSLSGSKEFVGMFFDEAHLAARLSHPNIAQIHDFGVAENRYFIAMEYIAGEDLSSIINQLRERQGTLPVPLAARIMLDVCAGLDYAHTLSDDGRALEIIHRDVSPSNIMVSYQGAVKLLDFGIAKATSRVSETRSGSIKGKLSFLAPELIRGLNVDARADLFSLGISLFALLTRQHPFRRDSEVAAMHAITESAAPDPRGLRPDSAADMVRVVGKALEADREKRFSSAAQLGAALQDVIGRQAPTPTNGDLAAFLATLFGNDRRDQRSRIPTLARLNLEAVVTPLASPAVTPLPTLTGTPQGRGRGPDQPVRRRFTHAPRSAAACAGCAPWVAAAGGGLLLMAAGAWLALRALPRPPAPAPTLAAAPPPRAPGPEPAVPPTAQAQPAPAGRSGAATVPTRARLRSPAGVKPGVLAPLAAGTLAAVVAKAQPRFTACMKQHASALPAADGQLRIEIAVNSSGAVSAAHAEFQKFEAPALAGCLEREARRLRFPAPPRSRGCASLSHWSTAGKVTNTGSPG